MDATLNWTLLCVTRHLNRAVQMKTASIFNIQTTIYTEINYTMAQYLSKMAQYQWKLAQLQLGKICEKRQ